MKLKLNNEKTLINPPFYYGWIIVFVSCLSVFFSGPGQTFSISIFIDYYIADFEYSRSFVSGIYSTATLCAGFSLFFIGRLVDRFGQRVMMTIVGVMLAIACIWNAFITGAVMMFIGIFLLRLFGQGSMTLLPNTLVPKWFMSKRGRALSVMTVGGFAGSALFPPLNTWIIGVVGWRSAWLILGLALILLFVPLAILLVRNQPQDIGETPDGSGLRRETNTSFKRWNIKDVTRTKTFWIVLVIISIFLTYWLLISYPTKIAATFWITLLVLSVPVMILLKVNKKNKKSNHEQVVSPNVKENEISWSLKEAMRTRAFWFILFCVSVPALVNTGVTFHIVSIAEGKGLTAGTAALVLSLMAIFGFPVSFVVGYLVDRYAVHYILAVTFIGHIVSLGILWFVDSTFTAIIFGVVWGIVNGFERIALNIVWPNYFGMRYLGSIKGLAQTSMVVASALGPLPFGLFYDNFGGYQEVIILVMLFPITAAILALLSPQPNYDSYQQGK
ncbi:MFS transporter [Aquibacillus rhizosphaerae]|uniref:MFS transporter n=1 Tax=Aquibacillus rhizosphaerae TaxID=3051431 RepID=A0ABT7L2Q1_9BACI|nr:MFS transporter [Aquibacillus sp. LR5S19]MDL4840146.1 MFS transporter [Aquibacillus sp. LR5S19]